MCLKNNIPAKKYSLSKDIIAPFRMAYQSHPGRKLVLLAKHFEALNKMMVCRTSTLGGVMFVWVVLRCFSSIARASIGFV